MEVIDIPDESPIPVINVNGQHLIIQQMPIQGFAPPAATQPVTGNNGFEVLEIIDPPNPLITTSTQNDNASYVQLQLVDKNPGTTVVCYVCGSDGSVIPVYDNVSLDNNNTFTIIGGDVPIIQPPAKETIPSHILDHAYAKKPKEPGAETPSRRKPRKSRAKKQEDVEKAEFVALEDYISNTPRANILRKGPTVKTTLNPSAISGFPSPAPKKQVRIRRLQPKK